MSSLSRSTDFRCRPPVPQAGQGHETLAGLAQIAQDLHAAALRRSADSAHTGEKDRGEAPGLAFTCAVFTGDLDSFRTGADVLPVLVEPPSAANGWRSQCDFRSTSGERVSVELISDSERETCAGLFRTCLVRSYLRDGGSGKVLALCESLYRCRG